ncbi:MAG: Lrp/AsnC family transcriptional regulator [Chloroflexi bacterium]|nr:Lrp/AsnC family transcriptional regulator [Chloroflexota bacterium]
MLELDDLDKRLLNTIQAEFPMEPRPFRVLGEALGASEDEVLRRIVRLKDAEIIRQLSAIFDTRSLGYQSSLVAMNVDPAQVNEAAEVINTHPGVSHNYKRNHAFNLWFTIALPPASSLEGTVQRLHELAGANSTRLLPTLRLFKIGVKLDMTGEDGLVGGGPSYTHETREKAKEYPITSRDIDVIRALQEDLPVVPEPFAEAAAQIGMTVPALLDWGKQLQAAGHLRRFAAILYHRRAGFSANAMGVWKVPGERALEVGAMMGTFNPVSHCYLRPVYEDWPYNIFTMIHGRKARDCEDTLQAIAEATGIREYAVLYSSKEYKKTRVRYFTPELDQWEEEHLGVTAR